MHATQTSTDAAVIRASRLDPAAFGVVFDRHWVRIHRYCVVRAGPSGGAGRADVRAGAMLALSTLPDVKVTQTSLNGHPVVQITNTQFPDDYAETLDLDARTGVLVYMSGGTVGKPDSVQVNYRVSRVTVPSLEPAR